MADYILSKLNKSISDAKSKKGYSAKFEQVQQYVTQYKLAELSDALRNNDYTVLTAVVKDYCGKAFSDSGDELVKRIIDDMTGYGFLNKYFADKDNIEEININSWDSVIIRYKDGRKEYSDEHFRNPKHARDVLDRIMRQSGKHLDENKVCEVSYAGKAIRIAAAISPVTDEEVGIAASIRFMHSTAYDLKTLIQDGTVNDGGARLLSVLLNHRVSICCCGGTNAGKTTFAAALLKEVPDNLRVITLEAGTRDFELIRRNAAGKVINDRVHLQTREHKDAKMNVDLQALLDLIMRCNPDIVAVGEMVSEEAFIAAETARTGKAVITTVHTNNAFETYHKLYTLGLRKYNMKESVMMQLMVEAFPIIVYIKLYDDNVRRIQSILEGYYADGAIQYNELYRYRVEENIRRTDGTVTVKGAFEKVNPISDRLARYLMDNGIDTDTLGELMKG